MHDCNEAEQKLLKLYHDMSIGTRDECKDCHDNINNLSDPISCWCVGKDFYKNPKRILFVGKNARGNPGTKENGFRNTFQATRNYLWDESWPYWSYTREITQTIFGDDSVEHIAFTNIIKCNNSSGNDTTPDLVKENCILKFKILQNEIKIINPTHIIFYTARNYDAYILKVFDTNSYKILYNDDRKQIGSHNTMCWQEATADIDNQSFHILRTGHPQFKKRIDFVNEVSKWIKDN